MNLLSAFTPPSNVTFPANAPLVCFSHLRWDFVLQRPQHLMQRFSLERQVFFFEEFIPTDHHLPYLEIHPFEGTSVKAIRPRIPHWWSEADRDTALSGLLDDLLALHGGGKPILWFYTPTMFGFAKHVDAATVIYDCMDELANFKLAPSNIGESEEALMAGADAVFTGGVSLYEAKKNRHDNIHPFPSSVDAHHFRRSRDKLPEPIDQESIPHPRFGFYGVIDERLDLGLIQTMAKARPGFSFVFLGPVAKISPDDLPRAANIHYLGRKTYADLPAYLSGWDVALMPFALNEATRFISPTKTPEYLAAGRPVVSTRVADVVRAYENVRGVFLADGAEDFGKACEDALAMTRSGNNWLQAVDDVLALSSWDTTFDRMSDLVDQALLRNAAPSPQPERKLLRNCRRTEPETYDYLIVGAGFAGSVLAERLAEGSDKKILLCDKRPHIAGNAFDYHDEAGILVHKYGPHIFHTNSEDVIAYLSRFTAWRPYEHRVLAQIGNPHLPVPINRATLNDLHGLDLSTEAAAAQFLAARAVQFDPIVTSEDAVISQVRSKLYQTFSEDYNHKHGGLDPSDLDLSVTASVLTRSNQDDRYFLDTFQAMPLDGYTSMFKRMLDHENITVMLGTDFADLRQPGLAKHTIFTGPVDEYFEHRFGHLPYRCLEFRHETHDTRRLLPVGVINFPSLDVQHTRVTEYKYLTGQVHRKTSIGFEYACAEGEPYYPIPHSENQSLYMRYEALARERDDVTFAGRLGTYKYYDIDEVVEQALATYRRLRKQHVVGEVLADDVQHD